MSSLVSGLLETSVAARTRYFFQELVEQNLTSRIHSEEYIVRLGISYNIARGLYNLPTFTAEQNWTNYTKEEIQIMHLEESKKLAEDILSLLEMTPKKLEELIAVERTTFSHE